MEFIRTATPHSNAYKFYMRSIQNTFQIIKVHMTEVYISSVIFMFFSSAESLPHLYTIQPTKRCFITTSLRFMRSTPLGFLFYNDLPWHAFSNSYMQDFLKKFYLEYFVKRKSLCYKFLYIYLKKKKRRVLNGTIISKINK